MQEAKGSIQIAEELDLHRWIVNLWLKKSMEASGIAIPKIFPILADKQNEIGETAGSQLAGEFQIVLEVYRVLDTAVV